MIFEEKVLALLTGLTETVSKQGEQITAMQATLAEQGKALAEMRAEHGALLKVLDERSLKSAVLLETDVPRDINRLYEAHGELKQKMDTLATKEQVEELADEVSVIKEVVTGHSRDIGRLKKAQ